MSTPRAPNFVDAEIPVGAIDGANHSFIFAQGAAPALSLRVFRNGVLYTNVQDLSFVDGNTIILTQAPQPGDTVQVFYRNPSTLFFLGTNFVEAEIPAGAYDGVNNTFVITQVPDPVASLEAYWNGLLLAPGIDYSLSGTILTLLTPTLPISSIGNPTPLIVYYRIPGIAAGLPGFADAELLSPDGAETVFNLVNVVAGASLKLYKNGILLTTGVDFTYDLNAITFPTAPLATDQVLAYYRFVDDEVLNRTQSSNVKADLLPYLQRYLDDPEARLWPTNKLASLVNRAEIEISQTLDVIWTRFAIGIQAGIATYVLPTNIKSITRMTYRGRKIAMVTQQEAAELSPIYRTQRSTPKWATWQFEGIRTLRLFPVPAENLPILSDEHEIYNDTNIQNEFVVSAYVHPTESTPFIQLPDWLARRTIKLYILWKCYLLEGPGQSLETSQYYRTRYEAQMLKNKEYLASIYAPKLRELAPVAGPMFRPARPVLPVNFGEIVNG